MILTEYICNSADCDSDIVSVLDTMTGILESNHAARIKMLEILSNLSEYHVNALADSINTKQNNQITAQNK